MKQQHYDTVIMGGGLAGLSLALQLKGRIPDLSIAVIERNRHPVPEAAHKVGESTVELATFYFAEVLGLKEHLKTAQLPKLGLRFFFEVAGGDTARQGLEHCLEVGPRDFPPSPSYQLDRGIFENFLGQRVSEMGIDFIDGARVLAIELRDMESPHQITYECGADKSRRDLSCRWVVDATSRQSLIKRRLGLKESSDHLASAAWFRIAGKIDISEWSTSPEWKTLNEGDRSRWFSTNHMMGHGFWVWVIPLASGSTSIGIVTENQHHPLDEYNSLDKAMAWLDEHVPIAAAHLRPHLDKLQDFRFLRNFSHSAKQVYSRHRWFLTGEAGTFLDPFYSPGSDMIAISNTFVTNLIEADRNSEPDLDAKYAVLDRFYIDVFKSTKMIYQDKYQLFGNPLVMPMKLFWDTALYWCFTAFLFIQGKFFNYEQILRFQEQFQVMDDLNRRMHDFFLLWNQCDEAPCAPAAVDIIGLDFFLQMNANLYADFSDEEFDRQFLENVGHLRVIFDDIISAGIERNPQLAAQFPFRRSSPPSDHNKVAQWLASITAQSVQPAPASGPQQFAESTV